MYIFMNIQSGECSNPKRGLEIQLVPLSIITEHVAL